MREETSVVRAVMQVLSAIYDNRSCLLYARGIGMVGTEFISGQGLGNQLFCYVTARAAAEENGYEFGTAGQERFAVNMHSNRGMYFMDMDLGHAISQKDRKNFKRYDDKEVRLYIGNSKHDMEHGCYIAGADEGIKHVADNTLIYGNMQDESYFINHLDKVRQWLKVKPEYDSYEYSREDRKSVV